MAERRSKSSGHGLSWLGFRVLPRLTREWNGTETRNNSMTTLEHDFNAARDAGRWTAELWKVTTERTRTHQAFTIQSESGVKIADTVEDHRDVDGLANARKIAAAPALHFALATLQANPNDPRAHRIALDALALLSK